MPLDRESLHRDAATQIGGKNISEVPGAPLWRCHFPVDMEAELAKSRRDFVGGLAIAGSAVAAGKVITPLLRSGHVSARNTTWPERVLEPNLHQMKVGETHVFHFPDERSPCLLVKVTEESFVAYHQKCTHLACPVVPDVATESLHCPCHHGHFELKTGNPVAGPPRHPLGRIDVRVAEDGTLTAYGILPTASPTA